MIVFRQSLVWALYWFVILQTPPEIAATDLGKDAGAVAKLGPRTVVTVIILMIALMALVFWLFISFGRRVSQRQYMGPLAQDAIARAGIALQETRLMEDLRSGRIAPALEPTDDRFKKRYRIPQEDTPPPMTPGVAIDECGRIASIGRGYDPWSSGGDYGGGYSGNGFPKDPWYSWYSALRYKKTEELAEERKMNSLEKEQDPSAAEAKVRKLNAIEEEIRNRFERGYQQEQVNAFTQKRVKIAAKERERARGLLPTMDVSSFGGGWVFVLEFTTIMFIVFAVLALGLLGVLDSEPIAAILAAIAGYVLGKSTSIRETGGEEVRRGAEVPKELLDALRRRGQGGTEEIGNE